MVVHEMGWQELDDDGADKDDQRRQAMVIRETACDFTTSASGVDLVP
jgi:hypothetical protein